MKETKKILLIIVGLALLAILPLFLSPNLLNAVIKMMIAALFALAFTLAMGQASRVILMSSLPYHERKAYQPSIEHLPFLQKPFSVETLMQVVDEVLAAAPLSPGDSLTKPTAKQDVRWFG